MHNNAIGPKSAASRPTRRTTSTAPATPATEWPCWPASLTACVTTRASKAASNSTSARWPNCSPARPAAARSPDQRRPAHRHGHPSAGRQGRKPLHRFRQVKIPMGTSAGFSTACAQAAGRRSLRQARPGLARSRRQEGPGADLQAIADEVLKNPRFVDVLREQRDFIAANYQTCDQQGGKRGSPLRRGSVRGRQEGRHRLPRHPVNGRAAMKALASRPSRAGRGGPRRPCPPARRPPSPTSPSRRTTRATPPSPTWPRWITPSDPHRRTGGSPRITWQRLDQEQLDQIYARLTAGPIPTVPSTAHPAARGGSGKLRLAEIVGGFAGTALQLKGLALEEVGEDLWRARSSTDERVLRNRIEDLSVLKRLGTGEGEPKKMNFNGKETWLLFPAKLYCGQSLLDARRESIVIDYFSPTRSPAIREYPDFLAGRWPAVRDEIRMIRPGLYLGRAYPTRASPSTSRSTTRRWTSRAGSLHQDRPGQEDCWPGTQQRKLLARQADPGRRAWVARDDDPPGFAVGCCWPRSSSSPRR